MTLNFKIIKRIVLVALKLLQDGMKFTFDSIFVPSNASKMKRITHADKDHLTCYREGSTGALTL